MVNLQYFGAPFALESARVTWFDGPVDGVARWIVYFLFEGKFITLFSFLFGTGMALQMERAEARGGAFAPTYLRRTLILLLFGLAHGFLIWSGDILTLYGVMGFLLLLFRNRSSRAMKVWAVILILAPFLFTTLFTGLLSLGRQVPEAHGQIEAAMTDMRAGSAQQAETLRRGYGAESWATVQKARTNEFVYISTAFLGGGIAFWVLGIFLVGLLTGRAGLLRNAHQHLALWRRVLYWGIGLGLPLSLLYAFLTKVTGRASMEPLTVLLVIGNSVGGPLLTSGLVAGITLLSQHPVWSARLALLAPMGRMALTNYLLQSIICTTLFYGYGLGLYGKVGPVWLFPIALVVWGLQIPFSRWWLARFRFGPAEWLWRSLTYLKLQPMRI